MKKLSFIFLSISLLFLSQCASTGKRLDANADLVSDTGELTSQELRMAAQNLAQSIGEYFKSNPNPDGVFVALLPTKNDTSEEISTDVFDNTLVDELRKRDVFTLRIEDRKKSLQEIQFSMTGLTEKPLSVGKMKSPNYFIKTDITEDIFTHKGKKIVEQTINIELRDVLTQVVQWSDRITYRKKAVTGRGVSW